MISVQNVSRRYNSFVAVGNVSFSIEQGEIVGLLGHNGAGKTTIMKMLTGFLEPSAGDINIDGYDISDQTEAAQSLIGYLPENLPVYPEMIVVDYLDYCAKMRDLKGQSVEAAVKAAIDKTELHEKALQPISTLSRGYKQRVGVAQALLHNPKLLILDEPTNGLDPHQTHQMRDLIRNLAGEATVILSTHIMQEVDALCSRVLILDHGDLAVDSTLEELRSCDAVKVETYANASAMKTILGDLKVGKDFKKEATKAGSSYLIPLNKVNDLDAFCADLASEIIKSDNKLYQLTPQHRDLETVFKEIQQLKRGVNHAA